MNRTVEAALVGCILCLDMNGRVSQRFGILSGRGLEKKRSRTRSARRMTVIRRKGEDAGKWDQGRESTGRIWV